MSENQTVVASQQEEEISEDHIIYSLAAFGINSCFNSYDPRTRTLADNFCKLDLSIIANMWDTLDDRVKIKILNINSQIFKSWINSYSRKDQDV